MNQNRRVLGGGHPQGLSKTNYSCAQEKSATLPGDNTTRPRQNQSNPEKTGVPQPHRLRPTQRGGHHGY